MNETHYCIFCDTEATHYYEGTYGKKHVCFTCMEAMEVAEWYGKNNAPLDFVVLDAISDEVIDEETLDD